MEQKETWGGGNVSHGGGEKIMGSLDVTGIHPGTSNHERPLCIRRNSPYGQHVRAAQGPIEVDYLISAIPPAHSKIQVAVQPIWVASFAIQQYKRAHEIGF